MIYRGFEIEAVKASAATWWDRVWKVRGTVDGMRHLTYTTSTQQKAIDWVDKKHNEYLDK